MIVDKNELMKVMEYTITMLSNTLVGRLRREYCNKKIQKHNNNGKIMHPAVPRLANASLYNPLFAPICGALKYISPMV